MPPENGRTPGPATARTLIKTAEGHRNPKPWWRLAAYINDPVRAAGVLAEDLGPVGARAWARAVLTELGGTDA